MREERGQRRERGRKKDEATSTEQEEQGKSLYTLTPDRPPPGGKYWYVICNM
jgi:hypothetical protein